MKRELVKGAALWKIQQVGSHLFITSVGENGVNEETITCWSDKEAEAGARERIDAKLADGYVLSDGSRRADAQRKARADREAEALVHYDDLASQSDLGAAIASHFAPIADSSRSQLALETLASRVREIELNGLEFTLRIEGGRRLICTAPSFDGDGLEPLFDLHKYLWFYDDDSSNHRLHVGAGAGPPEGDAELERTALAGHSVRWLLEESPNDRYWFAHPLKRRANGLPMMCSYAFDGGLGTPRDCRLGALVLELLEDLIEAE